MTQFITSALNQVGTVGEVHYRVRLQRNWPTLRAFIGFNAALFRLCNSCCCRCISHAAPPPPPSAALLHLHSHSYLFCLFCCDLCNILGKLSNWYKKQPSDRTRQTRHNRPSTDCSTFTLPLSLSFYISLSMCVSVCVCVQQSTRFEFLQFRCVLSLHSVLILYSG